jgi:hypothetical protein
MLGLGQRIEHWVGPDYTLMYLTVDRDWGPGYPLLVPSIVYRCPKNTIAWQRSVGEFGSVLCGRDCDWLRATVNTPFGFHEPGIESRLPKPYSKGNGWYPAAMAAIKTDVARFDTVDE